MLPSCHGEQRQAETPQSIRVGEEKPDAEPTPELARVAKGAIVWTRPEDSEQATSYWLDPEGNIEKQASGIFLSTNGKEWQFATSKGSMPVYECDATMAPAEQVTGHKETQVPSLIESTTHRTWDLWDQPQPSADERYADYSQNVGLIASAGRYLVIADFTWVYGCGAHGFNVASYTAFDLETSQRLSLISPGESQRLKGHEQARAVEAFAAAGDGFDAPTEEQITLINVIPEVTQEGKQRAQLVFSIGTCYACTHGEGSSYTATTRVVAEELPRVLAEQPLPKAVSRFAATHEVRGWTSR